MWCGKRQEFLDGGDDVRLRAVSTYADKGIVLRCGVAGRPVDRLERRLMLDDGSSLPYDRLVLATGARARDVSVAGADAAGVHVVRTLAHAAALRDDLQKATDVVVVGGGFIGLEVAVTAR